VKSPVNASVRRGQPVVLCLNRGANISMAAERKNDFSYFLKMFK
jgi:hypothetical protein